MPSVSYTFTGTVAPAGSVGGGGSGSISGGRIAWTLTDLSNSTTYSWEVNPKTAGTAHKKLVAEQATSAEDGRRISFEGRTEVQKISFSGTVLTQGQYNELIAWFRLRRQVKLTDDLGREFMVYILSFNADRVRSKSFPWKHTFSGEFAILDWV